MSLYVSNRWHSNACLLLIRIRNPLDKRAGSRFVKLFD
jgi:hypothetical protein